jgi:hypothetical protein
MKLHLLLLASLISLSSAKFMAELTGHLTEEQCTGEEFVDFKNCLPAEINGAEWGAFMDREEDNRKLGTGWCGGCQFRDYPKGTFCFTVCQPKRRLDESPYPPTFLRRAQEEETSAVYKAGEWEGTPGAALDYAKVIMHCLGVVSPMHPCVGKTDDMTLRVTV